MDRIAVLDASALIAFFDQEPGGELVEEAGRSWCISTVNLVEVSEAALRRGIASGRRHQEIEAIGIAVIPFTAAHAETAAALRPATRTAGLSLADRACLALALGLDAPALTADRSWAKLDVGVEIELIR